MNNSDSNKKRMYQTVNETLLDNKETWKDQENITSNQEKLGNFIKGIDGYSAEREKDGTAQTLVKHLTREDFVKSILKVAGGMAGFTTARKLYILRKEVCYTPSAVQYAKDSDLCDMATNLYNAALPYKDEMGSYLLAAKDVDELNTNIMAYKKAIPGKRVATGASSAAKEAMGLLFEETDLLLKDEMDYMMLIYRDSNPIFYSKYRTARAILDLGHGKKRIKDNATIENKAIITGFVYDVDSKEKLAGAKVLIEGTNIWMLTDSHGKYLITLLPETYTIHAEKEMYIAVNESVILKMGDTLDLDLGIKKE